jgi:anti-sigma factor RsiW
MCPDRELLSAYFDGEVPSPWRERIAEHLASCAPCASVVAGYEELARALKAEDAVGEAQAVARGRARLEGLLAAPALQSAASPEPSPWKRSVRLPLPAAAAAVLIALAAGGAAAALALGPSRQGGAVVAASSAAATPAIASPGVQPSSMDELLRYIDAHAAQVTITMNLPTGTRFDESGEPVIIRASQESGVSAAPVAGGGGR